MNSEKTSETQSIHIASIGRAEALHGLVSMQRLFTFFCRSGEAQAELMGRTCHMTRGTFILSFPYTIVKFVQCTEAKTCGLSTCLAVCWRTNRGLSPP